MNIKKWLNKNANSLQNKVVAITGSTGGLGTNICQLLCELNADIILLDRDKAKTTAQIKNLTQNYPNIKISFIEMDLLDFKSVNIACDKLKNIKLDYLILNAGIYNVKREKTSLGFDNVFQVNFLMPYYITKILMSALQKCKSRVIAVSSIAHNYSKINEKDIEFLNQKKSSKIYGNSKRFLTYALLKLFENENSASLTLAHPGITLTNMTNHYPKAINWLVKFGIKILFPNPKKASLNIVKAMFTTADRIKPQWVGPAIFNIWGKPKLKVFNTATKNEIDTIYEIAENLFNDIIKR